MNWRIDTIFPFTIFHLQILNCMHYPGMNIADLVAAPLYLLLFYLTAYFIVRRKYTGTPFARLFYWGLSLKFLGCIGFALVYQFYYGMGDTFRYYGNASTLVHYFLTEPATFLEFMSRLQVPRAELVEVVGITDAFSKPSTFMVIRAGALFGLLGMNLYLPTSLFFAFFSFLGVWALYRTSCYLYPALYRWTAIPILFIPSCFFWGSAYMQESLLVGALGIFVWLLHRVFLQGKFGFFTILLMGFCLYILTNVKEYVLLAFLPATFVWIVFALQGRIRNPGLRWLLRPLVVSILLLAVIVGLPVLGSISERYNVEQVLQTAEITARYLQRISREQGGSIYSLGEVDFSPLGLLQVAPRAVVATLFRPWPWEVRNPVMLLSALEGTVFLLLTLFLFFKVGPFRLLRHTLADPFLLACLLFSLAFAFATGVTTYNFGSLARYKIPCLFFYGLWLAVSYGRWRLSRRASGTHPSRLLPNNAAR